MRAALFGALILLAAIQLMAAVGDLGRGWQDLAAARSVTALRAVNTELLLGARAAAQERRLAALALADAAPSTPEALERLAEAGRTAAGHLRTGLARLPGHPEAIRWSARLDRLSAALDAMDAARPGLAAILARPAAERDGTARRSWEQAADTALATLTGLLLDINRPGRTLSQAGVQAESLTEAALWLRMEAGRDLRELVDLLSRPEADRAAGLPDRLRADARMDLLWQQLHDAAAQIGDGVVDGAVARAETLWQQEYGPVRLALVRDGVAADGLPRLMQVGDAALTALGDVVIAGITRASQMAEERRRAALSDLVLAAGRLLLGLCAVAVALVVVQGRVLSPIRRLTNAMADIAGGRLDTKIPATDQPGEIGDMARALAVFKSNALQLGMDAQERERTQRQLQMERRILELAASPSPLPQVLDALCLGVESLVPAGRCSVLLLAADGLHIQPGAAPNLPQDYCAALNGVAIGPAVGSCGTAMYRRQPVVVADIAADPLWQDHRGLALAHGLAACWSLPILSGGETPEREPMVLGAFAIYHHTPRTPADWEMEVARRACHLAAIAIGNRRAAAQLEQAKAQAELGSRTKSEFLANMSHELRTPLNAIIGFAEVLEAELQADGSPIANAGYAADIVASGRHLLTLINDILDVSKLEAGKVELRERICDMADLLATCERIVRARAMERGLELRVEIRPGMPPVLVDDVKFKQIVLNLLSNAIKFTDRGGRVTVRVDGDPRYGMVLEVADTGIGIREEDLPKVFIPFHQVDNVYARSTMGTGLGLTLSRGLAELHGGTLTMESRFGQGTTVRLRLPAGRLILADMAGRAGPGTV